MKITAVETVQIPDYYNLVWTRLHTDEGILGLGESWRNAHAVASYMHDTIAPYLIGRDPLRLNEVMQGVRTRIDNRFGGFPTRSVEMSAVSAVDMALWDILGKALGQPVHQLLGGLCRDRLPVYNTCVRPGRNNVARRVEHYVPPTGQSAEAGVQGGSSGQPGDNLNASGELAEELLSQGFTAMKFSPYDIYAEKTAGHDISLHDLNEGIRMVAEVRKAVGDRIDIYVDYHNRWHLTGARKIVRVLDEYGVAWHEDVVQMHNFDDLAAFRRIAQGSTVGSEAMGTVDWFREALKREALDVLMFDVGWVGGISEARDIAALARAFGKPFAPHDATGPLILTASVHVVMASPAALKQEIVRVFLNGYYRDILTELPRVDQGYIYPMSGPGLGTELQPGLLARQDAIIRRTTSSQ